MGKKDEKGKGLATFDSLLAPHKPAGGIAAGVKTQDTHAEAVKKITTAKPAPRPAPAGSKPVPPVSTPYKCKNRGSKNECKADPIKLPCAYMNRTELTREESCGMFNPKAAIETITPTQPAPGKSMHGCEKCNNAVDKKVGDICDGFDPKGTNWRLGGELALTGEKCPKFVPIEFEKEKGCPADAHNIDQCNTVPIMPGFVKNTQGVVVLAPKQPKAAKPAAPTKAVKPGKKARLLGEKAPDIGSKENPVVSPYGLPAYRKDGFWYYEGYDVSGSGKKSWTRVTDPASQARYDDEWKDKEPEPKKPVIDISDYHVDDSGPRVVNDGIVYYCRTCKKHFKGPLLKKIQPSQVGMQTHLKHCPTCKTAPVIDTWNETTEKEGTCDRCGCKLGFLYHQKITDDAVCFNCEKGAKDEPKYRPIVREAFHL